MALQGSGAISLANLQTEFGGSPPISMSEYYRGALTTSNNANVPTSGAISLSNFYGATAFVPDYTPNALNWTDISDGTSGVGSASGFNNTLSVTGTNQTITMRMTASSVGVGGSYPSGSGSGNLNVSSSLGGLVSMSQFGFGDTLTATFTVPVNASLYFFADVAFTDQLYDLPVSGAGGCTITITNETTGGTVIDTFSVYLTT